jgi:hypothetical protein
MIIRWWPRFCPVEIKKMFDLGWVIAAAIFGVPVAYVVLRIVGDTRAEFRIKKKVAATRRTEVIDSKKYSVVTRSLPVLREKRTGRIGIALERGGENDPTIINGELALEPRWIKIQFVRKSDGKTGRVEWRGFAKFENVGTADVDFLTHRAGLFRAESFIRYPVNFWRA